MSNDDLKDDLNDALDHAEGGSTIPDGGDWDAELSDDEASLANDEGYMEEDTVVEFEDDSTDEVEVAEAPTKKKNRLLPLALVAAGFVGVVGFVVFGQLSPSNNDAAASKPEVVASPDDSSDFTQDSVVQEASSLALSSVSNALSPNDYIDSRVSDTAVIAGQNTVVSSSSSSLRANGSGLNVADYLNSGKSESPVLNSDINQTELNASIQKANSASMPEVKPQELSAGNGYHDVATASSSSVNALDDGKSVAELTAVLLAIQKELGDIRAAQEKVSKDVLNKVDRVERVSSNDSSNEVKASSASSVSERDRMLSGRSRLPGFQITSTTEDKTMSIVKVVKPGLESVIVLFKGELFKSLGQVSLKVISVEENGELLLVGDKWYIDKTLEIAKPVIKPPVKKRQEIAVKSSSSSSSGLQSASSSSSLPSNAMVIAARKPEPQSAPISSGYVVSPVQPSVKTSVNQGALPATGWVLNMAYNDTFIITSPAGVPMNVTKSSLIPGLGTVNGLNESGDLIVGGYKISPP